MVHKEQLQNWADDLTAFEGIFKKFAGLEDDFTPDYSGVDIEEINKKYKTWHSRMLTRKAGIPRLFYLPFLTLSMHSATHPV